MNIGDPPDAFEKKLLIAAAATLVILGFACYWGWI